MNPRSLQRWSAAVWVLSMLQVSALAHHSFAMYDTTKRVTLTGVVKQFRWVNPHAFIVLTVRKTPDATPVDWAIEMSSPANMARYGWSRMSLGVGESVEVTVTPLRDGSPGAACQRVKRLDAGTTLECNAGAAIRVGEKPNLPGR